MGCSNRFRPRHYGRKSPLVLINGLAEQAESWYRNRKFWARFFDVHTPNILAYEGDGAAPPDRGASEPITVDYLVGQLHTYLDQFVQTPPYHLVVQQPGREGGRRVRRPLPASWSTASCCSARRGWATRSSCRSWTAWSGSDAQAMVRSVFHKPRLADREMLRYYKAKFTSRRWKTGLPARPSAARSTTRSANG